ncbi:MAG: lytic transglycosylase domain-containing protein [Alphaproteobacteria bacterium]|nr:lytic transglycosylase domain-containing protein [Alphaproteobacteria bacterium]
MIRRLALTVALLVVAAAPAHADEAVPQFVPSVLSQQDVRYYREIIADERVGKFSKAQALYEKLEDKSLKGYLLAEHILSPHSRRIPLSELITWMRNYGDLPIAHRVYKLAVKRATKHIRKRHHKTVTVMTASIPAPTAAHPRGGGYEDMDPPDPPIVSDAARAVLEQISSDISDDSPDQAFATLQALIAANTAPASDISRLSQRVCYSYLAEGMNDKAFALGDGAATTGRADAPLLDWCAGLAAFRLHNYGVAAKHFETLAQVAAMPNWTRSAAAFWAARSYLRAGDPSRVITLLTAAAREEPTFYGLLAERVLGQDPQTGFADPVLLPSQFAQIVQRPAAHRAVALWQIDEKGYDNYVNAELNRAFGESADLNLDAAFAGLARALDVPNLELRASETSAARGLLLTGLFPIPQYKPLGGYTIDPSLVLAFARIETRFQATAVSPAGAKGLMQLMPATAAHIGGRGAYERLFDPGYNMSLGQRFIAQLLDRYNGNLVELCAAYNAGPTRVSQWMAARDGREDDPLMFIESMRAPETRSYVKRLLTYYWMYHRRTDDAALSLDEAARGDWPTYHPPQQSAPPPPPLGTDEDDDNGDNDTPSS